MAIQLSSGLVALAMLTLATLATPASAQTISQHFARVNGAQMRYVRAGSGSPVLLVHGFPRTWRSWERVIPALAKSHTVIAPDMPGIGESAPPRKGYDPNSLSDDLNALMRSLRLNRYAVVAHDLGGPTGYALAARHRESVTKLCLIETAAPHFGLEKVYDPASSPAWYFGFFLTPNYPEMLLTGRERPFMTAWMLRDEGPNAKTLPANVRPFFRAYTRPGALLRGINWYRGLTPGRAQNLALQRANRAQLTIPTLAIGASRAFGRFTLDGMKKFAPQTRGVVVEGRHFIHEDNPQGVLAALSPFLAASRAAPAQATVPASGVTSRFVFVNGVRLHYLRAGRGAPLLLLHGFPQTGDAWRKIMPSLAKRFTVIAPDLRGMGRSQIAPGGYDKKTLGEDNYKLMRALGFSTFHVVGHDFGGSTAYALAAQHPESVRRLVLIECVPAGLLSPAQAKAAGEKFGARGWFAGFNATPNLSETLVAGREGVYLNWLYDNFSTDKRAISPQERARYIAAYAQPGRMRAAFTFYRTGAQDERDGAQLKKRKLTMPVLCIGGANAFGDTTYRALRNAATNVRGQVFANCGHFVPEEAPQRLTQSVLTFLQAKSRP